MDAHDEPHLEPHRGEAQEPVGSLADEATRLFGALGDWARDQGADPGAGRPSAHGAGRLAGDCTWCPICRTVHAVRQTSPEVRDQLLLAATSLMQAGAGLLAALQASTGERGSRSPGPAAGDGVEHIDLDDAAHERPGEA